MLVLFPPTSTHWKAVVENDQYNPYAESFDRILRSSLKLRDGSTNILQNRENSQLEFKESFNLNSLSKYARTMAAFANNKGGYLVFGVEPSPHRLKGVNTAKFAECDPAHLTQFLNSHLGPEIEWDMNTLDIFGVTLGYIHAAEAADKPIVALSNGGDIKNGDVYYRYKGQTSTIRYSELRAIIDSRIERERQAWLQHLRTIDRVGPRNVGILDTIHGKLYGAGPPFLIDETLLRKLKFIRRGQFSESEGEPTLRVLGDVQSVAGVATEKPVPTGIHSDDLITAFLALRPLDEAEARSYLREATYQNTPYLPIHYFIERSGLSPLEAQEIVKASNSTSKSQKKALIDRIAGMQRVKPIGSVQVQPVYDYSTTELDTLVGLGTTEKEKRTFLLGMIRQHPKLLQQAVHAIPLARLFEAVTHVDEEQLRKHQKDIFELLLSIFATRFQQASDGERSGFRKAVAFCDESLFFCTASKRSADE